MTACVQVSVNWIYQERSCNNRPA